MKNISSITCMKQALIEAQANSTGSGEQNSFVDCGGISDYILLLGWSGGLPNERGIVKHLKCYRTALLVA